MASKIDQFGGPEAYNHYAVGWAHAMDTPYQWTKQVASHWGGTRNGTIVHWPNGFAARGEVRSQFCHVIDVAPTVLDAAGLPAPTFVHGVQQMPHHGTSMTYSFDDAGAAERHDLQYFEMFVNRGIYHQGWTAVTRHSTPWVMEPPPAIDDDVWELYGPDDWTQAHDIAADNPAKLAELQRLFLIEATKYNVLPLDDRRVERFNADLAGRPQLIKGKTQLLFGGMGRLSENSVLMTKNKSHAITANVTVPDGGAEGVIIAQGGAFAGWCIYAKDGTPKYCYNLLGLKRFIIEGDQPLPPGDHQVRVEFDYDGGGLAKGATITPVRRRRQGRRRSPRRNRPDGVLRRRDDRRRPRQRHRRQRRVPARRERVHRHGALGADRHRRQGRRRRPPDHPRGTLADRDGTPVGVGASWNTASIPARSRSSPAASCSGVWSRIGWNASTSAHRSRSSRWGFSLRTNRFRCWIPLSARRHFEPSRRSRSRSCSSVTLRASTFVRCSPILLSHSVSSGSAFR